MSEHEDIMADLFDAIEACPDCPNIETDTPSDMFAMRDGLHIAATMLRDAAQLFDRNMLVVLNETDHRKATQ